ncbi:DUF2533 family protein [Neobacillus kokaensis]|uniref:DUF2533 domain-containing protein n=1 Tax=Neobacillus kokaensis TaxID=2759023 RepID=A0ABQ3N552_9BACI|nr:DUF2533 family protein [Neobacillus kokaensis]GHH98970.1 hypothetical protein AM1BK_25130 [Neobacillus kokaensis]
MSVHKELIQHAANQNKEYQFFLQLDQQRESYIEEAINLCKEGKPFTTDKINAVTKQINNINLRFIPERKIVTIDMVREYVSRKA